MEAPITLKEIELAVFKLKMQKSPGPDGIPNEMIKNLRNATRTNLLQIFNICWTPGTGLERSNHDSITETKERQYYGFQLQTY
jgi:hypothetical protein